MACSACRLRDVAAGPCRALIDLQRLVQGPSLPESVDPVVTAFLEGVVGLVRGLAEAHAEPEDYEEPPVHRPRSRTAAAAETAAGAGAAPAAAAAAAAGKGPSPGQGQGQEQGQTRWTFWPAAPAAAGPGC